MERQLLHAPVIHVGYEQRVLARARDRVNPVELPRFVSGLAQRAENFPIERELVNSPRLLIGGVEVLGRGVRDADIPRLGLIGQIGGNIS